MRSVHDLVRTQDEMMTPQVSNDQVKLLRKLHWIGLVDEAECLQRTIRSIPANSRPALLSLPDCTD
jgi:hypothetical protein